eukprot:TRINITY_DN13337_c0_g1_i1.p1 TRINITY_DN13337_c0_g1~~TRINITY_DN13337_c0_g1_i1.p1  ORF type:complete len:723 (-),score=173.78 TRINITY_DN13337_c0_g1_i1:597-2708(-)
MSCCSPPALETSHVAVLNPAGGEAAGIADERKSYQNFIGDHGTPGMPPTWAQESETDRMLQAIRADLREAVKTECMVTQTVLEASIRRMETSQTAFLQRLVTLPVSAQGSLARAGQSSHCLVRDQRGSSKRMSGSHATDIFIAAVPEQRQDRACSGPRSAELTTPGSVADADATLEESTAEDGESKDSQGVLPRTDKRFRLCSDDPMEVGSNSLDLAPQMKTQMRTHSLPKVNLGFHVHGKARQSTKSFAHYLRDKTAGAHRTLRGVVQPVTKCLEWRLHEPERTNLAHTIVTHRWFEITLAMIITAQGLFTGYITNYQIRNLNGQPSLLIVIVEGVFLVCYIVEIVLKLAAHRLYFFVNADWAWNWFDVCLVIVSFADVLTASLILTQAHGQGPHMNVSFVRLFRFFRLPKVFKMFRAVRLLPDLKIVVGCVIGSFVCLFWCTVMVFFIIYVFSLFLMQGVTIWLEEYSDVIPDAQVARVMETFVSVERTMLVLSMCISGGMDWADAFTVIESTGPVQASVFLVFIAVFVFAIWNTVASTFVEKAFKLAQPDLESLLLSKVHQDRRDAEELRQMFQEANIHKHMSISEEEFNRLIMSTDMGLFLEVRGIDIKDAKLFFKMLCSLSDDQVVDVDVFVNCCLRMKGLATSIDLHTMSFEMKLMQLRQKREKQQITQHLNTIEAKIDAYGVAQFSPTPVGSTQRL